MREADTITGRYLGTRIAQWLRENPTKSQADLAKAAGLSNSQLSQLRSSGKGAGRKTLRGLARVFGTTPDTMEAEAAAWARAQPLPLAPAEQLPNRETAIELLTSTGRIAPETADLVREMSSPVDLDEDAWIAVLLSVERRSPRARVA